MMAAVVGCISQELLFLCGEWFDRLTTNGEKHHHERGEASSRTVRISITSGALVCYKRSPVTPTVRHESVEGQRWNDLRTS